MMKTIGNILLAVIILTVIIISWWGFFVYNRKFRRRKSFLFLNFLFFGKLRSHFAFTWLRNQCFNQSTSCEEFVLDWRQFVSIMGLAFAQIKFYIECIFSRFKKRKSAVKKIRIEYFCNHTVKKSQNLLLIILKISTLLVQLRRASK